MCKGCSLKIAFFFALLIPSAALAQPELDTSFNSTGIQVTNVSPGSDVPATILVQPDNKIIVIGIGSLGVQLVRYNQNGSLDASFGTGGIATVDISPGDDSVGSAAIQPDGKIVVVGPVGASIFLARFNQDGSLDATFGTNGIVTTNLGYTQHFANKVLVQDDGKLVVGGTVSFVGNRGILLRYNSNGSPDSSFGVNGVFVAPSGIRSFQDITIESSGNFLVLSSYPAGTGVARYSSSGTLIESFTGINYGCESLFLLENGKFVIGGSLPVIARYNSNGMFDATFGNNGIVFSSPLQGGRAITTSSDGGMFMEGFSQTPDFSVEKFNSSGLLDTTFSDDGRLVIDIGAADTSLALVSDPFGRLLIAGTSGSDQAIVRLRSPTVAEISGRVTSSDGRGINNAILNMDDGNGSILTARTNPFGYYYFSAVPTGPYTISVVSKRYTFPSRTIDVFGNLTDIDFVADP